MIIVIQKPVYHMLLIDFSVVRRRQKVLNKCIVIRNKQIVAYSQLNCVQNANTKKYFGCRVLWKSNETLQSHTIVLYLNYFFYSYVSTMRIHSLNQSLTFTSQVDIGFSLTIRNQFNFSHSLMIALRYKYISVENHTGS